MEPPLYRRIIDSLTADIRTGRFKPGQKLPSEAALLKKFRTSRITVGRALREMQTAGLIERRVGSGSYVAQQDEASLPLSFGLLIPDLGETEIFDPICRGIATTSTTTDYALLWGHLRAGESSKEDQCWALCRQFIERQVSGVFFAPLEFERGAVKLNKRILRALEEAAIPVVLLDRHASGAPLRMKADLVGINNHSAGYLATEHLISLGLKRIAFIGYQGAPSTIKARLAGYRDALHDAGLGELLLESMHSAQAEGFVCVNDLVASQLMRAFLMKGTRIPEDVRLVGIDDARLAAHLPVPLTTIRQPGAEIGQTALGAMLERVRQPTLPSREILLAGELVVRESSGMRLVEVQRPAH